MTKENIRGLCIFELKKLFSNAVEYNSLFANVYVN